MGNAIRKIERLQHPIGGRDEEDEDDSEGYQCCGLRIAVLMPHVDLNKHFLK